MKQSRYGLGTACLFGAASLLILTVACGGDPSAVEPTPAPTIVITGVEEGVAYTGPVTPNISVDRGTYEATLDGAAYVSGTSINAPGRHSLTVVARNAGRTSSRSVSFSIGTVGPISRVPARGTAATLDFVSWNVEWFGDTGNGPSDEHQQLVNVAEVIAGTDADIWGLQEVVSRVYFDSLLMKLPGYAGLLATAPAVTGGSTYYNANEQKVALLYKTADASLIGARVILTQNDADFAGRPPLEAKLRLTGTADTAVVIVLHMKAFADVESQERRARASGALKTYLDATYPTQRVWVIGDWNDDLDTSITAGRPSPFRNFLDDPARYSFPTKALTEARISSTVRYADPVDHHLVTNEAAARFVTGSATAYRIDAYIPRYSDTTSDHYPVLTRYTK